MRIQSVRADSKSSVKAFFLFVFFAASLQSCGDLESKNNTSEIKWGLHQMGLSANLLKLLPQQSVEVCAQTAEQKTYTEKAIEKWATVIGRWGHFTVNKCGSKSNLVLQISGFNQTGLNYFTKNPGQIYANSQASGKYLEAILLHEVGHSWGMCDQYTSAGNANCSSHRGPMQDNGEIMGSTNASKLELRAGDITGIKYVANMSSTSNDAWKKYLNEH